FGEIPGLTDIWLPGSSYSHLDFLTYAGAPNGLMVPFLARGLAYENPGEITLAIYNDLGWNGKINREVMADNSSNGSGDDSPELGSDTSNALTIYPNPFVNSIAVDMVLETRSILKATVYDMYGASMQIPKKNIQGNSIVNIDLSKLRNRSDLYFLQLTFDNGEAEIHKIMRNN
ncbi:MAG: T9SS type A sorting domain-containing protein, partial [Eudoraea sp.]